MISEKRIKNLLITKKKPSLIPTIKTSKFETMLNLAVWGRFTRCVYTELSVNKDGQFLLDFHISDSTIYTNIGIEPELDKKLNETNAEEYFMAEGLIKISH